MAACHLETSARLHLRKITYSVAFGDISASREGAVSVAPKPPTDWCWGFYSHNFIILKRDGGMRMILDLL